MQFSLHELFFSGFRGPPLLLNRVRDRLEAFGYHRNAFTLIEMLAAIAILSILLVVTWAGVAKPALHKANAAKSQGNMRAIGVAIQLYVQENGKFPFLCGDSAGNGGQQSPFWSSDTLTGLGYATGKNRFNLSPIFLDPLLPENRHQPALGDYGANQLIFKTYTPGVVDNPLPAVAVRKPSRTILATTAEAWNGIPNPPGGGSWMISRWWPATPYAITNFAPADRGLSGVLSLFADGHVELVNKEELFQKSLDYMTP